MKRILVCILFAAIIVSSLTIWASATREEEGSVAAAKGVAFTIEGYTQKPVIDGVISEGEYTKVELQPEWMIYIINNEEDCIEGTTGSTFDLAKSTVIDFYGTFDADNLYLAWGVHISPENYVQNWTDSVRNMHAQTALQVKIGDGYITTDWNGYDEYIKFQVARNKETGALADVMLHNAASVSSAKMSDITYQITYSEEDELLVYELQIPTATYSFSKLETGSKVAICWTVCVGGDPNRSWNNYSHIQMAYGCSGNHGSACNGLAQMTCGTKTDDPSVNPGNPSNPGDSGESGDPIINPEDPEINSDDSQTTEQQPQSTPNKNGETSNVQTTGTTEAQQESSAKKGCKSSMAFGGLAALMMFGGAVLTFKRKK